MTVERPEKSWNIQAPLAMLEVATAGGTPIIVRRHGNPDGPRLFLSHGNGLAVDMYYPFWSLLCDQFDLIVYDIRNHGWNPVTDLEMHNIAVFVDDGEKVFDAVSQRFGPKSTIGVFHSLSALIALIQAANTGEFSALFLLDPPIAKPGVSEQDLESIGDRLAAMTRIRQYTFDSREQFLEILDYVPLYSGFVPGAKELASKALLRPSTSGTGYELRCPPEYEAQVLDYVIAWSAAVDFEEIHCPTKVIGADPTIRSAFLPSLDLAEIVQIDYDFVPDAAHLVQLERPKECAEFLREFIETSGVLAK